MIIFKCYDINIMTYGKPLVYAKLLNSASTPIGKSANRSSLLAGRVYLERERVSF